MMTFLRWLAAFRCPALNAFFLGVTELGAEVVFMIVALTIFWCVNKREGYFVFFTCLFGTAINQALKIACRVPRPWVLDPDFQIVEAARADAGGYSFPSGHTQNIVGLSGAVFASHKNNAVRTVCAVLMILVPFSRMYLGVHTPADVGAAFVLALGIVWLLYRFLRDDAAFPKNLPYLLGAGFALCLAFLAYLNFYPFPADIDAENLSEAVKNAHTLLGCTVGFMLCAWLDKKYLHFSVEAPLPGQILKAVFGLTLLLALRAGLKAAFAGLGFTQPIWQAVRYFAMIVFAGGVWPLSFPLFAKIGSSRSKKA